EKEPIGFRETYDDKKTSRKAVLRQSRTVSPKIEADAKKFEKLLSDKSKQKTEINNFNLRLKNHTAIREYILFSEILGKPKALRR
ncbi:MAG TPA: hypothetical protein PK195_09230, partial [Ignavibacteriaceae bacterium]|nr:hypothetical protein [Ignavibacteriaceae bacterium]